MKKNKFSFKKQFSFIKGFSFVLLAIISTSIFHGALDAHALIGSTSFAMTGAMFYDQSGNAVYGANQYREMTSSPNGATGSKPPTNSIIAPPNCVCNDKTAYIVPDSFTMTFTNAGAAATGKTGSFDNIAEAILGTLGTVFPTIDEFPNGAGTVAKQDGTNIFGMESILRLSSTYAIAVKQLVLSGAVITANSSEVNMTVFKGNIKGVDREFRKMVLDSNNSTPTVTMTNNELWYWTANKLLQIALPAASTTKIRVVVAGYKPYSELI